MPVPDYSNKSVTFRFSRQTLEFYLSQQLFSSFDIDPGSKLLLKFCAELIKSKDGTNRISSVLDIGCGTGTLGLSLAAAIPDAHCTLQDRDALAVSFSKRNAARNNLKPRCTFIASPAFSGAKSRYDLVVSNIPAKAGNAVIQAWVQRMSDFLTENGTLALVIVKTLSRLLRDELAAAGFTIESEFANTQYAVYICTGGKAQIEPDSTARLPAFYIRQESIFSYRKFSWEIKTVYNLPDFDRLGFDIDCALRCLDNLPRVNSAMCIHNGQGHLPVFLSETGLVSERFLIADSDTLALNITCFNLAGRTNSDSAVFDCIDGITENPAVGITRFDLVCLRIPENAQRKILTLYAASCLNLLNDHSYLIVYGKATPVNIFSESLEGLSALAQHKNKGFRSILYKKVL